MDVYSGSLCLFRAEVTHSCFLACPGGGVVGSVPLSRGRGGGELAGLREVLDNLLAAVAYLAGEDLVVEFANDEFRQLLGGREVLGRPVCDAVPELAGQGLLDMLRTVRKSGQPVRDHEAEFWLRRHGNTAEQVFLDYVCQPVPGPGPGAAGVLLFAADVTGTVRDRRGTAALAAQLTATQDRYRTLFETLPDGVIYYSADGLILGANPAARQILGLPAESMLTWPLPFAWQAIRPDGTTYQPDEIPVAVALRTGQVVSDMVMGIPRGPRGELQWLGVTAVPDAIDEDGKPQRAYAIFRDLTRQRQTEAALREGHALMGRLREANVLGVVLVGEDRVHDANDAFLDIVGYGRADLEAGRLSYQVLTPPEWAPRDAEALQQLRRAGAFRPYEKEYVHADGHRVPVLVGAAVTGRRPLRWITYVVDLTARQRAEQERATLADPGTGRPGRGGRYPAAPRLPHAGRSPGRRRAGPLRAAAGGFPAGGPGPGRLLHRLPAGAGRAAARHHHDPP